MRKQFTYYVVLDVVLKVSFGGWCFGGRRKPGAGGFMAFFQTIPRLPWAGASEHNNRYLGKCKSR